MIVVALAALAYTWFTGIFASLTSGAETAVETTTEAMGVSFRIEAAKRIDAGLEDVSVTVRNVGTSALNVSKFSAYVDDGKKDVHVPTAGLPVLVYGETYTLYVNDSADPTGKKLKLVAETGLEQTTTIT